MKLKSLLTALASVTVLFFSCLKSHNTTDLLEDKGSIVTVISDVGATGGEHVFSLNASPVSETLDLMTVRVYSSGNAKPNGPVHVKLAITNASGYFPMPASGYSIPMEFDIPTGTSEYKVPITIKKNMLDLSKNNGFQISIASVSQGVIGENDKKMVFGFLIKNQYDGIYVVKGYGIHPTAALVGPFNYPYCDAFELITSGTNSVDVTPGLPTNNGGGISYFSGVQARFNVNPTTNAVTITDAPGNTVVWDNYSASYPLRWDPATKTFFIKTGWSGFTRVYTDTFTYCGPRQ